MAASKSSINDKKKENNTKEFMKHLDSKMNFVSDLSSAAMNFEWIDVIYDACPFIEKIVKTPKLTLINEYNVEKIERAKKINVDSVKDLATHTNYIETLNPVTGEVQPSKILDVRSEETYNIYENRFLYTTLLNLERFVAKRKDELLKFELKNQKILEYQSSTKTKGEDITVELKVVCSVIPEGDEGSDIQKQIDEYKKKLQTISDFMGGWFKSELIKTLTKLHVPLVIPPIKKTNSILKNPGFQATTKVWNYIMTYDDKDKKKNDFNSEGDNQIMSMLNDGFLTDYFIASSIDPSRRIEKENLSQYCVIMLSEQIKRIIGFLLNSGIQMSEQEILSLISKSIADEQKRRVEGGSEVKKKFKSAIDEYLDRASEYL